MIQDHLRQALIKRLSVKSRRDAATPAACEWLSLDIKSQTGQYLSPNTLKRLTGVLRSPDGTFIQPQTTTLEILAAYLGYPDSRALETALRQGTPSRFGSPSTLVDLENLPPDTIVVMTWAPDRYLAIRHLEGEEYVVAHSKNGKLREGDLLKVRQALQCFPLLVREVIRDGVSLGPYSAATDRGLTHLSLRHPNPTSPTPAPSNPSSEDPATSADGGGS